MQLVSFPCLMQALMVVGIAMAVYATIAPDLPWKVRIVPAILFRLLVEVVVIVAMAHVTLQVLGI